MSADTINNQRCAVARRTQSDLGTLPDAINPADVGRWMLVQRHDRYGSYQATFDDNLDALLAEASHAVTTSWYPSALYDLDADGHEHELVLDIQVRVKA
jgi:hypothetical protein